jgi:murein DD-endopeptidase MepM/ murein hydrolase activator NlpD
MPRLPFLLPLIAITACAPQRPPTFPEALPTDARVTARPKAPGPAAEPWRPRPVVADAVEVEAQSVVVQGGDTLSGIAERAGSSVQAVARANNIRPPYVIHPGETLRIPAGRYHTVKRGETGIAIAHAYGVDWDRVVAVNGLTEPYILRAGQRLRLPTKKVVREMTLAERAAAFDIDIDDLISGGEPAVEEGETPPPARQPDGHAPLAGPLPEPPPFNGKFAAPLEGRIVSRFGVREGGLYNDGINIKATKGTPIRAAADGIVAYAGNDLGAFGNLVLVKHSGGWITAYAHAEALLVVRGDKVRKGDPIARVGESGKVDDPQLHFEIRKGRKPVNPEKYLPGLG